MSRSTPTNNPHDAYFKATFGRIDFAKEFLKNYLPPELVDIINIETLSPEPTSYLTKELKEQFTDLVYKAELKGEKAYITFFLEHKSYPDRMVIFQLLKYIISIWEEKIRNKIKDKKVEEKPFKRAEINLPIIIPLVVYHDKSKWRIKRSLEEMITNYETLPESIKKYIPNYEYLLVDISHPQKYDKIKLEDEYAIVIETLSKSRYETKEQIIEVFKRAIEIYTKARNKDIASYYITEAIIYIISTRDDFTETELQNLADQVSEEGGELIMTLAERLMERGREEGRRETMSLAEKLINEGRQEGMEKGIEKGIEEGIEKGIEKNRRDMAKNFLRKGISVELVAEASELTLKEVKELKKNLDN